MLTKNDLRTVMRKKRNLISIADRKKAAEGVFKHFLAMPHLDQYNHIGVYKAFDGEIELNYIIDWCNKQAKHIYYPEIINNNYLDFGINVQELDLVLVPLTVFDKNNNRIGLGKGCYDKTFEFKHNNKNNKPLLIGIAYDFQEIPEFPIEKHDVKMDEMFIV